MPYWPWRPAQEAKGRIGGVPVDSFGRHRRRLGTAALLPLCALLMWGGEFGGGFGRAGGFDVSPSRRHAVGPAQSSGRSDGHANSAPVIEQSVFLSAGAARSAGSRAATPGEDRGRIPDDLVLRRRKLAHLPRQAGPRRTSLPSTRNSPPQGLSLNDISVATGGRSDTASDPPYLIHAYMMAGQPGSYWLPTVALDHPDAAGYP